MTVFADPVTNNRLKCIGATIITLLYSKTLAVKKFGGKAAAKDWRKKFW